MNMFVTILIVIFLLYLNSKITQLAKKVDGLELTSSTPKEQVATTLARADHKSKSVSNVVSQSKNSSLNQLVKPDVFTRFMKWMADDWLMKLGALLVIVGMGWFVTYAFAQNWIGPLGRISLGMLFGASLMLGGFWRSLKYQDQGTVLLTLGAGVIMSTTYAAREVYDFLTPTTALILMVAVAALIAYSSVKQRTQNRAILGLLIASIAPFLTVTAAPSVAGLFLYLFMIISGTIWIVLITDWRSLLLISVVIYALFSIVFGIGTDIPEVDVLVMQILTTGFAILFYGIGVISGIQSNQVKKIDIAIKSISALVFLEWVQQLVPEHLQSMVLVVAGLFTVLSSYFIFFKVRNRWLVILHASLALIYLALAVSEELVGPTALLAYIGLVTVGVALVGKLSENYKSAQLFGLPFVPLSFIVFDFLQSRNSVLRVCPKGALCHVPQIEYSELFVTLTMAVTLLVLGRWLYSIKAKNGRILPDSAVTVGYLVAGLAHGLFLIWFGTEKMLGNMDVAHGVALLAIAVIGIVCYVYGRVGDRLKIQYTGSIIVGW